MAENRISRAWPAFETHDLGDSDADAAEMERRWAAYAQDMAALIAAGGVHRDADGWWVDDATGELIGPDPEIERPATMAELAQAKPFAEMFPALAETAQRGRGPQKRRTKVSTTIRLSPDVIDHFKQGGAGWQSRIDAALKEWVAGHS